VRGAGRGVKLCNGTGHKGHWDIQRGVGLFWKEGDSSTPESKKTRRGCERIACYFIATMPLTIITSLIGDNDWRTITKREKELQNCLYLGYEHVQHRSLTPFPGEAGMLSESGPAEQRAKKLWNDGGGGRCDKSARRGDFL